MRTLIFGVLLGLFWMVPAAANQEADALVEQAIRMLAKENNHGDTSSPMRLLQEALEQDPGHPEALWQILYLKILAPASTWRFLHDRSEMLAQAGPLVAAIVENAHKRGNPAFAHYVTAYYAAMYDNDEIALAEIDQALKYRPESIWYRYRKSNFVIEKGIREKDDGIIDRGLAMIEEARRLNYPGSDFKYGEADFDYFLAVYASQKTKPDYAKVIAHYQAAIDASSDDQWSRAVSLAKQSEAYRKNGQCEQAKQAAEQSLATETTRDGKRNLQFAGFCLQLDAFTEGLRQARNPPPADRPRGQGFEEASRN